MGVKPARLILAACRYGFRKSVEKDVTVPIGNFATFSPQEDKKTFHLVPCVAAIPCQPCLTSNSIHGYLCEADTGRRLSEGLVPNRYSTNVS